MWPSNTRLCWRECWFIFYHSEDIGEASFFGNTSVDFWVLQHFWHAPLATGIWSCIGIPKISINLASRCFLPVLSYRSSTIYLEKIPLDYRNFSPRSFHHLKFFTWQWSLHLGHVALPKYHFFRIFFHLAVNAWNRWITRGLVPTWDPKSSMTFRVRNPRVRTQGPRSSEMAVEDSTTAASFGTLTDDSGIPPNRTMKEINTYPLFPGGTKVLRKEIS